jgi:antitoxin MazE
MNTTINTWGNSLGIRIPANFISALKLKAGSSVVLSLNENNFLQIQPVYKKKKLSLKDLSSKINTKNKHKILDWGESIGKEI